VDGTIVGRTGVGVRSGSVVGVERGGRILVGVGVDVGPDPDVGAGFPGLDVAEGGLRVLMAVRKIGFIGVTVTEVFPAPCNGQPCNATGNKRQLDGSEQIFKLKVVSCVPLQTRTRLPLRTSAVRQVTGAVAGVSTSKIAKSGKISTACGRSFTQN
jgi:hypothetical protein